MPETSARATARDPWLWALVAVLVAAIPLLVHQGREQSFHLDEFDFIVDRRLRAPATLFAPWYGHWVTLPAVAYRLLLSTFGLRTYLPYQALAIAGHFAVVLVAWATARRLGTRGWIATATMVPLVVLGSGRPNILFGFQVTLTAALALGLTQLLLATHHGPWNRRDTTGLACGFLALMCSGVAVSTTIGVGAAALVLRGWRTALAHTAPLAAAYTTWWLLAPDGHADPEPTLSTDVIRFALDMTKNALRGVGGSDRGRAWPSPRSCGLGCGRAIVRRIDAHRDRAGRAAGPGATAVHLRAVERRHASGDARARGRARAAVRPHPRRPGPAGRRRRDRAPRPLGRLVDRCPRCWCSPSGCPATSTALDENVPPNTVAPYVRSEHLATADGDRMLHPLMPVPVALLQDAARNPSAWADVEIAPGRQLLGRPAPHPRPAAIETADRRL